jgi:serine/threonine protein kinase
MIDGFCYLYSKRVIHRDVKLENLLIHFPNRPDAKKFDISTVDLDKEEFIIKIADFGLSRVLDADEMTQSKCGTPLLMAPEVL